MPEPPPIFTVTDIRRPGVGTGVGSLSDPLLSDCAGAQVGVWVGRMVMVVEVGTGVGVGVSVGVGVGVVGVAPMTVNPPVSVPNDPSGLVTTTLYSPGTDPVRLIEQVIFVGDNDVHAGGGDCSNIQDFKCVAIFTGYICVFS